LILSMKPPYEITGKILQLITSISQKTGEISSAHISRPPAELRKKNRIRTIQASLEIEGNVLSEKQITALLEGKKIIAPAEDILEVKNAIKTYNLLHEFNPFDLKSFLKAHKILMEGLIDEAGQLRTKAAGILKGSEITHIAPPGDRVKPLMMQLFDYLKKDDDPLLIKSCVFHYELEFIHPFRDGNGRMGRLWQTLILMSFSEVFEFIPAESLIKKKQLQYYGALGKSDKTGKSTPFIEFMLQIIDESLEELLKVQNVTLTGEDRIEVFRKRTGKEWFSRTDYLRHFKEISTATASRDLKSAAENGILIREGDKRNSRYRFSE
jgi:Fic family protein